MSAEDPDHYKVGGIESIDVIRAKLTPEQYEGFCLGNAMKYVHRAGHKGSKADDIKKAIVYLGWAGDGDNKQGWVIVDLGPNIEYRWQVRNDGHCVIAFPDANEASAYVKTRKTP